MGTTALAGYGGRARAAMSVVLLIWASLPARADEAESRRRLARTEAQLARADALEAWATLEMLRARSSDPGFRALLAAELPRLRAGLLPRVRAAVARLESSELAALLRTDLTQARKRVELVPRLAELAEARGRLVSRLEAAERQALAQRHEHLLAQALAELARDPARVMWWQQALYADRVAGPRYRKMTGDARLLRLAEAARVAELYRAWLRRQPAGTVLTLERRAGGTVTLELSTVDFEARGARIRGRVGGKALTLTLAELTPAQHAAWAEGHMRMARWSEAERCRGLGSYLALAASPWRERGEALLKRARELEARK